MTARGRRATPGAVVISADASTAKALAEVLANRKVSVRVGSDHDRAGQLLQTERPELVLLDLENVVDPVRFVARLRESSESARIVLLIPKGFEAQTRFESLLAGADDYAIKPLTFDRLGALIEATLGRSIPKPRDTIDYADLSVSLSRRSAERAGEAIDLSAREFDLLMTFVRHPRRVYTRAQLVDLIWGAKQRNVGFGAVERHVSNLRAKIDRPPRQRLIQTIVGIGYALR
jgi:two-component system response regulator MprA